MIPGKLTYNLINTPDDPIPELEPVFLLRAQDELAVLILDFYAALAEDLLHRPTLAAKVREHRELFRVWPTRKSPD